MFVLREVYQQSYNMLITSSETAAVCVMVNLSRILRRPQQQARRVYDKPARERHFLSIICSVLSSIFLILALALKVWANGEDSRCTFTFGLTQVSIDDSQKTDTGTRSSKS